MNIYMLNSKCFKILYQYEWKFSPLLHLILVLPLKACNFIKKEYLAQVFSCEFCEISKNTFITEHLQATASYYFILVLNKWVTSTVSCNLYCVANIVSSL